MKRFFILLATLITLTGCSPRVHTRTDFALNTVITITLYGGSEELLNDCLDLCREYENILSHTVDGSDIWRINRDKTAVLVNPKTAELIVKANGYSELSGGLFDISIGALSSLWQFEKGATPPSPDEILENLKTVDFKDILVQDNKVSLLREGARLDLGAIAKGYIADEIAKLIKSHGVKSAIVNLGGNVVAIGGRDGKTSFKIGIKNPNTPNEMLGVLHIRDKSIVTSGIYERNFMHEGKEYHHILNPKTGMPHENNLVSVTVISDLSVDGDAFSTSLYLMGAELGFTVAENMPGIEAIFVLKDASILKTSGVGREIIFDVKEDKQ